MQGGRIFYAGQQLALATAAVAIVANGLTWLNIALSPIAVVCMLFTFPLFAGGLISYLSKASRPANDKAWVVRSHAMGQEVWKQILSGLSRWQLIAAYAFTAYVFLNFFETLLGTKATHQELLDPALQVRIITGHTAIFLLVAAGLFRATRRLAEVSQ
jgi:hypothetical protein